MRVFEKCYSLVLQVIYWTNRLQSYLRCYYCLSIFQYWIDCMKICEVAKIKYLFECIFSIDIVFYISIFDNTYDKVLLKQNNELVFT